MLARIIPFVLAVLAPLAVMGAHAGYEPRAGPIIVNRDLLGEDPTALVALLAHELAHALQTEVREDQRRPCLELEVDAYWTQAYVWSTFSNGDPPTRTDLEETLTEVSRIPAAEGTAGLRHYVAEDELYGERDRARCGLLPR